MVEGRRVDPGKKAKRCEDADESGKIFSQERTSISPQREKKAKGG